MSGRNKLAKVFRFTQCVSNVCMCVFVFRKVEEARQHHNRDETRERAYYKQKPLEFVLQEPGPDLGLVVACIL